MTKRLTRKRLTAERDRLLEQVQESADQLARTQEWLERFQGGMANWCLKAEALQEERDELTRRVRSMRALLVEADSYLGLWRHRYAGTRMPDDLRDEVDDLRRRLHPHVAAGGRGETAHAAASRAVDSGPAGSRGSLAQQAEASGSNPVQSGFDSPASYPAPTGAVRMPDGPW